MPDSYTEIKRENIFTRTRNSIGGMVVGVVLVLAAFPVLWLNEGRSVKTAAALDEISGKHIEITASQIDSNNNNKLVYLQGEATTDETLTDVALGVKAAAIALQRNVQMYQWVESSRTETEEKLGGTKESKTTYTYAKQWSGSAHPTSSFKVREGHHNPEMVYESASYHADQVNVGAFELNDTLQKKVGPEQHHQLTQADLGSLPEHLRGRAGLHDGGLYLGRDPHSPQVGDYRISYSLVPSALPVSLLAVQSGNTFSPYVAKNGRELQFLMPGQVSAEAIVAQSQANNTTFTWILRAVGVLVMWLGFNLITAPLQTLASVVPMVGRLVGALSGVVSLLISLALSVVVIAVAWMFYRPLLGVGLLLTAAVLTFVGAKLRARRAEASVPVPPPAPSVVTPPPPPTA